MGDEDESLIVEGLVIDDDGGEPFLETVPREGTVTHGFFGFNLLENYVGKRVRVTVEVLK